MKRILTATALAALLCGCARENGALRMATESDFPPYEFLRGPETVGVDIELGRAVAEKLGRKIVVDTLDFDAVLPAVVSAKADFAIAGITVTDERAKTVDFSVPYVTTGIVVVYSKLKPFIRPEMLKGRIIGVKSATTSESYVLEKLNQEPVRFRTLPEAVASLKSGRIDFVISDVEPAKTCIKGDKLLSLSDFITKEDYAVAVRKGHPDLIKAINETIAEVKADGRLAKWTADYTAEADSLKQ